MGTIERYFVTSRLGRGVVRAKLGDHGCVHVNVQFFDYADGEKFEFRVENENIAYLEMPEVERLFLISRIAISQLVVQQARRVPLERNKLDLALKPWNGDLSETPFVGATVGRGGLYI